MGGRDKAVTGCFVGQHWERVSQDLERRGVAAAVHGRAETYRREGC
ncbi:hypothetical protein TIFTF001_025100 [Ficus carica]|uniref:Uncharacterized protein n=1 Tax=Ficus carica TaxID=3494 RepID=A0AA88DFA5_FICCA|nr:hypothetical protein TIFTF001_025100 [Ficus carica]